MSYSLDFNSWILGIGGYIGLFSALAVLFLGYDTIPKYYLPALILLPFATSAAFYIFFNLVHIVLSFLLLVTVAMLNEQITFVTISFIFLAGQIILFLYIIYHNTYLNKISDETLTSVSEETEFAAEETEDAEDTQDKSATSCVGECEKCECTKLD